MIKFSINDVKHSQLKLAKKIEFIKNPSFFILHHIYQNLSILSLFIVQTQCPKTQHKELKCIGNILSYILIFKHQKY